MAAPSWQGLPHAGSSVQPCVRPVRAVHMTAEARLQRPMFASHHFVKIHARPSSIWPEPLAYTVELAGKAVFICDDHKVEMPKLSDALYDAAAWFDAISSFPIPAALQDGTELSLKFPLPAGAGKVDDATAVEHVESVFR
jgi:hypothetical protein